MNHPLCVLAGKMDWREFDATFGSLYDPGNGRPGAPTRLMVGLHYLKHAFNQSDEAVVTRWVENPYWQYFCGMLNFTHELLIDPSLMTRWRRRLKSEGMEKLLEETIRLRLVTGVISGASFSKVNVDTTVQEKAITYPTDAKLYHRLREKLVSAAESLGATFGRATGSYRQTRCSCRGVTQRRVSRDGNVDDERVEHGGCVFREPSRLFQKHAHRKAY